MNYLVYRHIGLVYYDPENVAKGAVFLFNIPRFLCALDFAAQK